MTVAGGKAGLMRVAVIGGGIIGLSCALELKRRGAEVAVYERATELGGGATPRSAGMLGAAFEWAAEAEEPALAVLARQAGDLWPGFARRLECDGGGSVGFSSEGALVVAGTGAELGWLESLTLACQRRGLQAHKLDAAELKRLEPAVSGAGALLLPGDRQVDAPLVLQRLATALGRAGVGLKLGRPAEQVGLGEHFQLPDGEPFDRVVLATGAGHAPVFVDALGETLSPGLADIVPVKGQMLALAPVAGAPRHVIHARDVYIAPKASWVLVGATSERGQRDVTVHRAAIEGLRRKAARLVDALGAAPEIAAWAGIRPGTPDDAPMIGETAIPGVFAALGCYRNGVLLAPAVAKILADEIIDGKVSPVAQAFAPGRFDKAAKAPHSP